MELQLPDLVLAGVVCLAVLLVMYTYGGFVVVLWLWTRIRNDGPRLQTSEASALPSVSIIVAAYDEEAVIVERLRNLREQDYPADLVEVIVASDGSTDRTVERASGVPGVRVLALEANRGKASVNNAAAEVATGRILLFTDAETVFEPDFLRNAVKYFSDRRCSLGAGNLTFRPRGVVGESEALYWQMEKVARRLEQRLGYLPFASGACLLVRRESYRAIEPHSDIDNILPLRTIEDGSRVFFAEDARAYDVTVADTGTHYRKRVRTALRSMSDILSRFPALASNRRYGALFVLVSHRIVRWLSGYLGAVALIGNVLLVVGASPPEGIWRTLLVCQGLAYLMVFLGWLNHRVPLPGALLRRVSTAVYALFLAHVAFSVAVARAIRGERIRAWKTP